MNSTTINTKQLRNPAVLAADLGGILVTAPHAPSRPESALLKHLASVALGLLLAIPCLADAQQYTFTTISVPGATRTAINGNSTTSLAGEFDDADG